MKYYQYNPQTRTMVEVRDHHQDHIKRIHIRNMSKEQIEQLMKGERP